MTDYEKAKQLVQNDPAAYAMFKSCLNLIESCHLTPHEIRSIAMAACCEFELRNRKPIINQPEVEGDEE
jgi:hypothetical protein